MPYKKFFLTMFVVVFIGSISVLITPVLIQIWSQDVIGLNYGRIVLLFLVLLLAMSIELTAIFFRERFAKNFNIQTCKTLLNDYLNSSYDMLHEKGSMYLVERIAGAVNHYYNFYTGDSIKIWTSSFIVGAVVFMLATHNLALAIVLALLIPINYFGFKLVNKRLLVYSNHMQEVNASNWQKILSIVQHTDYIKQSSQQERLFEQITPAIEKIYGVMSKTNTFAQVCSQFLKSINNLSSIMIMAILVFEFAQNETSPLLLVLYTVILPLYFNQLGVITQANLNKRDMLASKEFAQMLKNNREKDGEAELNGIDEITIQLPELKINDRVLAYGISAKISKGDVIWVKGESGTGKSTLLKLLVKFRPIQGILINGIDLTKISNNSLREHTEYLAQNVPIINGSLRDNLFLGKKYSHELEVQMEEEPILHSILQYKNMDTLILADGSNLSGGEKQKIAIARALYNTGQVMILDEITSNIDKESADDIYKRLLKNHQDKIIFIISHEELEDSVYNKVLELTSWQDAN